MIFALCSHYVRIMFAFFSRAPSVVNYFDNYVCTCTWQAIMLQLFFICCSIIFQLVLQLFFNWLFFIIQEHLREAQNNAKIMRKECVSLGWSHDGNTHCVAYYFTIVSHIPLLQHNYSLTYRGHEYQPKTIWTNKCENREKIMRK